MRNFFIEYNPEDKNNAFDLTRPLKVKDREFDLHFLNADKLNYHLYNYIFSSLVGLIYNEDCITFDLRDTISNASINGVANELDIFGRMHLDKKVNVIKTSSLNIFEKENFHLFTRHFESGNLFPVIIYNTMSITTTTKVEVIRRFGFECKEARIPAMITIVR